MTWRANTDFTIVLSEYHLIDYITKYVTKHETRSQHVSRAIALLNNVEEGTQIEKCLAKVMMKMISQRDHGENEVARINLGMTFFHSSKTFYNINCFGQRRVKENILNAVSNRSVTLRNDVDAYANRLSIVPANWQEEFKLLNLSRGFQQVLVRKRR